MMCAEKFTDGQEARFENGDVIRASVEDDALYYFQSYFLQDNAELLSESAITSISEGISRIKRDKDFDIVLFTLPDMGYYKDPEERAESYLGAVVGNSKRASTILLYARKENMWAISGKNRYLDVLGGDQGKEQVLEEIGEILSQKEYDQAFLRFVEIMEEGMQLTN